ncbi:MAG: DNA repair protein RecN [bacterium]
MLEYLSISNLALIEELEVEFAPGLNVITGVTGAGKSLLLKALRLALGERADYELVAGGAAEAQVSVVFAGSQEDLLPEGWPGSEDMHFRRVLKAERKSPAYLNDQRARLETLQDLRRRLIDFHGQHEGQAVFDPDFPRQVLDRYGDYDSLSAGYEDIYREYSECCSKLEKLEAPDSSYQQRMQLLSYQVRELDQFEPQIDEWEQIEARRLQLESVEDIDSQLRQVLGLLEVEKSIPELLGELEVNVKKAEQYNSKLKPWLGELEEMSAKLEELRRQIHESREELAHSETEYDDLMDRRGNWLQQARKHNIAPEGLADYYLEIKEELARLEGRKEKIKELRARKEKLEERLVDLAGKLSKQRKLVAAELEKKIIERLKMLKLEEALFKIEVEEKQLNRHGKDRIKWLFASHSSAEAGPLASRVSGGEISRVLLAIKSSLAEADTTPVLVFDEIDTGISGEEADSVGKLLADLADFHQVICITHLPLVAARSDHHILLNRSDTEKEVIIDAQTAGEQEKIAELSRLISGDRGSEVSRDQARQLLNQAQK